MFTLKLENNKHNIVDINDRRNYVVTAVSGLNPPSATLFTSKSPNRKGVKHNGSSLNERVITITIKLLGDVEGNRNALYEWIDTEQYVKIYYSNGVKSVYCEGYVSDCEIDLFTESEEILLNITCGDPYWKDLKEISYEISNILRQFKFPFSIGSAGIPFSTIKTTNTTNILNTGTETGGLFIVKCLNRTRNLVIQNANDTSQRFEIRGIDLEKNWVIVINTDGSPKTVKAIKPDGSEVNLMRWVGYNATWFVLKRGNNLFSYEVDTDWSDVEMTVKFTHKYLGV